MFIAAILLHSLCLMANAINFTTVYEWDNKLIIFQYMAVFGERLFLSLDTYSEIPATLVWLPTNDTSTASPKLRPFPLWNWHKEDNCDSIQEAKGLEIDPDGRLWVVDQGSRNCLSKISIFNLLNDTTESVHQFPDTVISNSYEKRDLCDIVLDKTPDDYLAYITDSRSEHIIVYSRNSDDSWSVKTPGRKWVSLALSPNTGARLQLYLTRNGTKELYSLSVSELRTEGGSAALKFIGELSGKPYRMLIDSAGVLHAAFYEQSYLSKWNISQPFREQRFHEVRRLHAFWPFSFALDTNGTLWSTERNESKGWDKPSYKLLRAAVGERSYQFGTTTALTTPQVFVNGETTEVAKTEKAGTPQPALKSNETSGDFHGPVEDYRKSQSLNTIVICLFVCCFSCLVLFGIVIAWLTLKMRRIQTSLKQISMDNNRAEMSVFPDNAVYDDVGPENSNEEARPENPAEPLYSEVDPEPMTSAHSDYASARNPSPEPYEVPLHLMGNAKAGKPSEPVYDEVGSTEQENIYDDVGPGPSSGPSRNKNSGRKPTESVQYLKVLP